MGVDVNRLKGKIIEQGKTQKEVAEAIGIDRATFYRKMKNVGKTFTVGEIQKLAIVLSLTNKEATEIFLSA